MEISDLVNKPHAHVHYLCFQELMSDLEYTSNEEGMLLHRGSFMIY